MTFGLEIEAAKEITIEMFTFVFAEHGYLTLEEDLHTFSSAPLCHNCHILHCVLDRSLPKQCDSHLRNKKTHPFGN